MKTSTGNYFLFVTPHVLYQFTHLTSSYAISNSCILTISNCLVWCLKCMTYLSHPQCKNKIYTSVFLCVASPFSVSMYPFYSLSFSVLPITSLFLSPPLPVLLSFPFSFSTKLSVKYFTRWDSLNLNQFKREISIGIAEIPKNPNVVKI